MDTIAKIHREISKNYGDNVIENIWVDSSDCIEQTSSAKSIQEIKESMLNALKSSQNYIICFYTSFLSDEILKLMQEISNKNNRIYIYTKHQDMLQEVSHHSLVRVGENLGGSFVLIQKDKNIQGFFSTKDFDIEPNQLFLELDSNQCEDFWHYFITCFWKDAKKEFIAGEEKEIKEMHQKEFISQSKNSFDIEFIRGSISQMKINALILLRENSSIAGFLQDFDHCYLFLQDYKTLSNEILLRNSTSNFAVKNIGFDSIDTDIFIGDSHTLLYRLSLNDAQNKIFQNLRQNFVTTKEFKHSIARDSIIDKTIHYLDGKTAKVEEHTIHADSIQCPSFFDKDEFEQQYLDYTQIWQDKYPHICEITYSFDIIPFYTPKHFTKAALYDEWKNTHKALHKAIDKALKDIESIDKKQEELNTFKALLNKAKNDFERFFLGKMTTLKDIKKKLNEIKDKATPETLNIDSAQSYINDLQKHIETINDNSGEIDLKIEEIKKYNEWQKRKNDLEIKIKKLEQDYHTKQQDLETKEKEHKAKEANLDSIQKENKDKQALENHIKTEREKLQNIENELNSMKNDLENNYKEFSYNKKDSKKSSSSLAFTHGGEKQSAIKRDIDISIPREDRPSTGTLKEYSNERLLEISQWGEVQSAKAEAKRLKAELSVKKQDESQQKG